METIDFVLGFCTGGAVIGIVGLKIIRELEGRVKELQTKKPHPNK